MDHCEKRLAALGLALPPPPPAAGAYVSAVRTGKLLFLAGTLPMVGGQLAHVGKIDSTPAQLERGADAARLCALNALANIKGTLGSLDRVARIVSVNGFVNGVDGFSDSPKVLNGASELFVAVFGESGKHARTAVSVNGLPRDASVEIAVVVEVKGNRRA